MKRFDATRWFHAYTVGPSPHTPMLVHGKVQFRCSTDVEMHVLDPDQPGKWVYADKGREFSYDFEVRTNIRFVGVHGLNIFQLQPAATSFTEPADEESFVNLDRMPDESGHLQEIQRALRSLQLKQYYEMMEARYEAEGPTQAPSPAPPEQQHGADQ